MSVPCVTPTWFLNCDFSWLVFITDSFQFALHLLGIISFPCNANLLHQGQICQESAQVHPAPLVYDCSVVCSFLCPNPILTPNPKRDQSSIVILTVLPSDCRMAFPCHCHGPAIVLPWNCHGVALALPSHCHSTAMVVLALPCQCHCNKSCSQHNTSGLYDMIHHKHTAPFASIPGSWSVDNVRAQPSKVCNVSQDLEGIY